MNACHSSMYVGKQKLIEMDIQISLDAMPKINHLINSLPDFPTYKLKHILLKTEDDDSKDEDDALPHSILQSIEMKMNQIWSRPDAIVSDWLFLGDHSHCKSLETLKDIGITHILCCSDIIPTYYLHCEDITYARIPVIDVTCANIYDYFYAAKTFIDLCNPLRTKQATHKILIHCEMGISRSVAIVIAYLISSKVCLNEEQMYRYNITQMKLDKFEREEYNEYKVKKAKHNVVYMKLNEAYYFTQSCRSIIEPNLGFCKQLEKWERICHATRSTLQDLPKYTSPSSDNDKKLGRTVAKIALSRLSCECILM